MRLDPCGAAPRRRNRRLHPPGMPLPLLLRLPRSVVPVRRLVLVALSGLLLGLGAVCAHADSIPVRAAELRVEDGEVLLNAEFAFTLNTTLEEALHNGIPLYFVLEFELTRGRWYWFDEKVAETSFTYRVSYNALTRQYRVASGLLTQAFTTVQEVERFVGRVTSRPIVSASALTPGTRYVAGVRLRLDVNQLPKPFQVNALASRDWTLTSDWYRWTVIP
jgi:hypothetical protein